MVNWRKPVILALLYLTGSNIPRNLAQIKKIEKLSKKEIMTHQEKKLEKMLLHAWKNVTFYQNLLENSKVVKDGKINIKNFFRLPPLTQKIIKKEGSNLYSKDHRKRKSYENASGGSTGEAVNFIQDKNFYEWNIANKIYYRTFIGQDIGELEVRFWGSERDILLGREKLSIILRNWLFNRKELNSYSISKQDMLSFVTQLNRLKPNYIEGYVNAIYEISRFIKEKNLEVYSPEGILSTAGTLYPKMRELIRKVFKTNILNRYGSREVGDVACNCEKSDELHVSTWNNYIEILDDDLNPVNPGDLGRIYVTNLNNFSMPFIRYKIGDFAVQTESEKCICGRSTPLLKSVEGREASVFKTMEGNIIVPNFFIHFFGIPFNKGFISKFQIIQEDYELIKIRVVLEDEKEFHLYRPNIENVIKKVMGNECKIKWDFVNYIEPLDSGKFLYTKCEI